MTALPDMGVYVYVCVCVCARVCVCVCVCVYVCSHLIPRVNNLEQTRVWYSLTPVYVTDV